MSDLPTGNDQADLFPLEQSKLFEQATSVVLELLKSGQPSAWDLLQTIEEKVGWKARCLVKDVLQALLRSTPALRSVAAINWCRSPLTATSFSTTNPIGWSRHTTFLAAATGNGIAIASLFMTTTAIPAGTSSSIRASAAPFT